MVQEFLNTELKPYNALTREEKHILLDAVIDGLAEVWQDDWEVFTSKTCPIFHENKIYRTKPKEYNNLDIPWQVIDEKWKWAAMDEDKELFLFEEKPTWKDHLWIDYSDSGDYTQIYDILKLDTTGIVAEHSLTKRPERSDTPEGV